MRKLTLILLILIAALAVGVLVTYWPRISNKIEYYFPPGDSKSDAAKAQALIQEGNPKGAMRIIRKYKRLMEGHTAEGDEWLALFIEASEVIPDSTQLAIIYEHSPHLFDNREKSSLYVGDFFIQSGQRDKYSQLRAKWKGHETQPEMWFVLDSDKMLLDGDRLEAIEFLKSKSFEGKADAGRLVRLGLLNLVAEPQTAWKYFTEAIVKDPTNADLYVYRAKLLEAANKPAMALQEYGAALKMDPKSLYLRDQASEFFLRNRQYSQALELWADSLAAPSSDVIWFKALFWNKVLIPINFDWSKHVPPEGSLLPLVNYMLGLNKGQFWDDSSFEKVPDGQRYLRTQPATFWLRLLSALKKSKENEAIQLIEYDPFQKESLYPELELQIARVIMYRKNNTFKLGSLEAPLKESAAARQSPLRISAELFNQLDTIAAQPLKQNESPKIPADLDALLKSKDAFAALFLAGGWMEAALVLNTSEIVPEIYPEWYAHNLAQAIKINRGNEAAMEFLTRQKQTPAIKLLIGEMMIAEKNVGSALEQLQSVYKDNNQYGYRAAWLMSLIYIDKKEYAHAKQVIDSQPRLKSDTLGQETLARIALLEGKDEEALQIYNRISATSAEARSYLARKAYETKDWKTARQLTEQLLVDYPNNPTIRSNMQSILENEKTAHKNTLK
ncbi:MAG: hypothetical protein WC222_06500 [Parachlamydiales bacterium]|jgi:predicted Zn-dependent protease